MESNTPYPSSFASRSTAAAPSPNKGRVVRSVGSMIDDILSAPTTMTFLFLPVSMYCEAVTRANMKPLHAASMSKPKAFFSPHLAAVRFAVDGKNISGVTVAQIIISTSSGSVLVFSRRSFTALSAMYDVPKPSPFNMRLVFMPTLVIIHSSEVSTILLSSKLSSTYSGRYAPTPVIAAVIFFIRNYEMCPVTFQPVRFLLSFRSGVSCSVWPMPMNGHAQSEQPHLYPTRLYRRRTHS